MNPLFDLMSENNLQEFYFVVDEDKYSFDDYWSGIVEEIDNDVLNEAVDYFFEDIQVDAMDGEFILGKHDVEFRPSA